MKPDEENEEDGIELECDWTLKPVFVSKVFIMDELLVNKDFILLFDMYQVFCMPKVLLNTMPLTSMLLVTMAALHSIMHACMGNFYL